MQSLRHTRTIDRYNLVNRRRLNIVDDIIACSRDQMSIGVHVNLFLWNIQHMVQKHAMYKV